MRISVVEYELINNTYGSKQSRYGQLLKKFQAQFEVLSVAGKTQILINGVKF